MRNRNHHQHFQKRVAVFGAGQAGRMLRTWIPADTEFLGYIDNNKSLVNMLIDGALVRTLEDTLRDDPDLIWIAVLNREAEEAIRRQIREAGYVNEIRSVSEIRGMMDLRLSGLRLLADMIRRNDIAGETAELGVYRGDFAEEINRAFPKRKLFLFDTFSGFDERDLSFAADGQSRRRDFSDTSEDFVRSRLPHPEQAVFVKGYFPESLAQVEEREELTFAFVSLDADLYNPTLNGLAYFYPHLAKGGAIMVHDYTSTQFPGVREAVDAYAKEHGITPVPLADLHGTAVITKS